MLKKLLAKSLKTAVDFKFIKQVVGKAAKIAMIDYESFTETTTLEKLFRGRDGVAILFHIKDPNTGALVSFIESNEEKQKQDPVFRLTGSWPPENPCPHE